MSPNRAAFIYEPNTPFKIEEAPIPQPGPGEVVVKNHAVAVNPVEWKVQNWGIFLKQYPNVLGADVAGEVHAVGEGVRHVKKGDRVMGHAFSLVTNRPQDGGFQHYTVCNELVVARIPPSLPYTSAAVLPLSISTAAELLFKKETLNLPLPHFTPKPIDKTILIWGGSSSVGASAIQLATAAGLLVVTVCSPHNKAELHQLGAAEVYDYKSPTVTRDIIASLEGTDFVGIADCIGTPEAVEAWRPVYEALGGRYASVLAETRNFPEGIQGAAVLAPEVASRDRYVGEAVWGKYIPEALEVGLFKAKPDPTVLKGGLERVQEGVDRVGRGLSFDKIVVEL
ncbi:zinc-binding oxidoreductase CipB [Westerdykella ornata]|uniref:Zinc-binding oxidoreductase CipB n=1 Tax=Westerdykella ornata TaxID=318751 RepID=A0A6A6JQ27_WESOR|nr:zinc-binding oxidoreductase CipB [Westerdykella ornata]KAF2277069.1 zinc-binding oxidoreductase CipB [Westerdykella ornata]